MSDHDLALATGPAPYADTTTSTTTSTLTSSPPEPIPISQLNAHARATKASRHLTLQPDSNGIAYSRSRPSCEMICFMFPFPCLCVGCCASHSHNMELNESKQIITLESWPAFWKCCSTGKITIPYSDIASFIAIRSEFGIGKGASYHGAVITRNGTIYTLTDSEKIHLVGPRVIEWQRFVFGRHPISKWKAPESFAEVVYQQ